MKKGNKKGFWAIFNLFDLGLIAVAVILAAVLVISGRQTAAEVVEEDAGGEKTQVRYTVELSSLNEDFSDIIKPGDTVIERSKRYSLGTVEDVQVSETTRNVFDYANEVYIKAPVEGYVNLRVTISGSAVIKDDAIYLDDAELLRVGRSVNMLLGKVASAATVMEIERGETHE